MEGVIPKTNCILNWKDIRLIHLVAWGDEAQTRELYEKAFAFYDNGDSMPYNRRMRSIRRLLHGVVFGGSRT